MGTQRVVLRQRHVLDCSPGAFPLKPRRPRERVFGGRSSEACPRRASEAPRRSRTARPPRSRRPFGDTARPAPSERRPEREADLPRERVQRHVAAHQPRLGEICGERAGDGAVQALTDREDDHDDDEDEEGGLGRGRAGDRDEEPGAGPERARRARASASSGDPRASCAIGSWAKTITMRVDEEEQPDLRSRVRPASFFA